MSIQLPPSDLQAAEALVATGRFVSVEQVVSEAIRQLSVCEELRAKVQFGIDQADRGEVVEHDMAFSSLRSFTETLENRAR